MKAGKAWAALIGGALAQGLAIGFGLGAEWQAAATTAFTGLLVYFIPNTGA